MSSISNEMMRTSSLRPYQTEAPDRGAHPGVPWFVWEAEFAADSPLEEAGFEPSVPLRERRPFRDAPQQNSRSLDPGKRHQSRRGGPKVTKPVCSATELAANDEDMVWSRCRSHDEAQPVLREDRPRNSLRITRRRFYDPS